MRHSGSPPRSPCGTSGPVGGDLLHTKMSHSDMTQFAVSLPGHYCQCCRRVHHDGRRHGDSADDINCSIPSASPLASTAAKSSASALLKVTFYCVLLQLFKKCVPLIMTPPLVDLAVRLQPAQLLSEKTSISLTSPWNLYSVTTLGVSMRYILTLFQRPTYLQRFLKYHFAKNDCTKSGCRGKLFFE